MCCGVRPVPRSVRVACPPLPGGAITTSTGGHRGSQVLQTVELGQRLSSELSQSRINYSIVYTA